MLGTALWSIYLGLLAVTAIGFLIKGKYRTVPAKIDFLISIMTWIGLFGFVTNVQMLTPLAWKIVFIGGLGWDIIYSLFFNDYYGEELEDDNLPDSVKKGLVVLCLVIFIGPLYYGLYQYAF